MRFLSREDFVLRGLDVRHVPFKDLVLSLFKLRVRSGGNEVGSTESKMWKKTYVDG